LGGAYKSMGKQLIAAATSLFGYNMSLLYILKVLKKHGG
jgi:hypothetical protein